MNTIFTTEKVRNYQGQNSFVLKMKEVVSKWGGLTPNQAIAVEKCLNSVSKVNVEQLPQELKEIANYSGENSFVNDIKKKLLTYGSITENQSRAALKSIQKEKDKNETINVKWPTPGETIKVGRTVGQGLKEKYGLQFNPILLDITKILAISSKAVKFSGKMTIKRGDVCMCCAKTLTDEFSMLTRMGKICARQMKVEYITDKSQAERFREDYLKRVEEIGEMEFWVPKSKIVKWEGKMSHVLEIM
jgi:hypothetical protein